MKCPTVAVSPMKHRAAHSHGSGSAVQTKGSASADSSVPVQPGDLCVRINGELIEHWTFERYAELVRTASKITYTFLSGAKETDHEVAVFELVP